MRRQHALNQNCGDMVDVLSISTDGETEWSGCNYLTKKYLDNSDFSNSVNLKRKHDIYWIMIRNR